MIEPHAFWNNPARNPTQTRYTRFMETPRKGIVSAFTESKKQFQEQREDLFKNRFIELMKPKEKKDANSY